MKLYYGGFADYKEYTVADCEETAIKQLGEKINAPFLPITAQEITEVDGYEVRICAFDVTTSEKTEPEAEEVATRHCKKCDFTCETQGELLKHYRENHPKGD